MADPGVLHGAVLARLQTLTSLTIYDADVDEHPPADEFGRVYPYAVLWANPGWIPEEARGLCLTSQNLTWDARVTVAAGKSSWILSAIPLVRRALDGFRPTPGCPLTELGGAFEALKDTDTTPARWFTPLTFRTSV